MHCACHKATIAGRVVREVVFWQMTARNAATKRLCKIRICMGKLAQGDSVPATPLTQSDDVQSIYVELAASNLFDWITQAHVF